MKIKRYFARTLREALNLVKAELGADAVILSNNKVEGGIELVAAIDYDENLVKQKVAKPEKQPVAPQRTKQETPEWLSKLRTFEQNQQQSSEKNKQAGLKEDVVKFSSGVNQKQEPHITEEKVDKLVSGNDFSSLLNQTLNSPATDSDKQESSLFSRSKILQNLVDNDDEVTYAKPKPARAKQKADNIHSLNQKRVEKQARSEQIEWSQDPVLSEMKAEIEAMKNMMQSQLSGLAWGNFNRSNPHRAEILQRLYKLGLKPSISEKIIRLLNEDISLEDSWKKSLNMISKGVHIAEEDLLEQGGMIAFVGPTGVGKTTTIAKLASRYALKYGANDMALVSMDSYRVGAQEQLKIYGQLLRVPVYGVSDEKELQQTLKRLSSKSLVLIDTAGMNQNDMRMTAQLAMLRKANKAIKLVGVLSASAQSYVIHEVVDAFKPYGLDGCVVSKVDESTSMGGILSVLIEHGLPLHYITNGQKVPEDIQPARGSQLLKIAMGIVRERKNNYDYNDIAMSFVGELMQVNG